jgi:hypothetical protein
MGIYGGGSEIKITKLLDLENNGMNMAIDGQFLYIQGSLAICKYDLTNMNRTAQNVIFKKDGKARGISIFGEYVFIHDFLDLYILSKDDLTVREVLRLGENVSSDVCGVIWVDTSKAYVKIRNGWIYPLDINTNSFDKIQVSDSSFWNQCVTNDFVYAGTVTGELLEIDKKTLRINRKVQLCKKNVYAVLHDDGLLYTVSQDQTIKIVDATTFETICVAKKAVLGMVDIAGIYNDRLIVMGERMPLSFWDKKALQSCGSIDFPRNRRTLLNGSILFGCDHQGVYCVDLSEE